ncbi:Vesicle transport protein [Quillaja saponaria]|uniref:Vesicle transport protein n=1 Tax=Quillaja saponaria TaxID=32244 RepID=A0AAD7LMR6_QUISA|nr:Vesicle transport protein [Quillaja saponaria]
MSSNLSLGFDIESAVRSANDTDTFNIFSKGVRDIPGNFYYGGCASKVSICFTLGCGFIVESFFTLKGPKNQLAHMSSMERLPFTQGFIGSMVGTIYVSLVLHSYVLFVLFSVIQIASFGTCILRYFIFSWWISQDEVFHFYSCLLSNEMFWKMTHLLWVEIREVTFDPFVFMVVAL